MLRNINLGKFRGYAGWGGGPGEKHSQFETAVIGTGVRLATGEIDAADRPPVRVYPSGAFLSNGDAAAHEPANSTSLVRTPRARQIGRHHG